MLPRLSTISLIFKGVSPAHKTALTTARHIVGSWCLMRDLTPVQATTTLQTFWQTFNGGVVEAVAELVKQTVGILYLEELAHPEAIGQKIDGSPKV